MDLNLKYGTKAFAKEYVGELVSRFDKLTPEDIKKYKEEGTKKDFILPLFQALGWTIDNGYEVAAEEDASRGRVDYAFRIEGVTKFYIEAKNIKENLDDPKFIKQALDYAYHKTIPWVILTDFEGIKVLNSEWEYQSDFQRNIYFELSYKDYVNKFDKLWLLSKESFSQGLLDKDALEHGGKRKKIPVDQVIAADLATWREELTKQVKIWNAKLLHEKTIDESVQRLIDRFIFIRTTEDRGIEDTVLISAVKHWELNNRKRGTLITTLRNTFIHFNDVYNSELFKPHVVDTLDFEENDLAKIISQLYKNKDGVTYDFHAINADVLGRIYEQYLGYIQKKENTEDSGKNSKRKKQGIYYTPTYIVEYIVQNTLGKILKDLSLNEARELKILDPACGSGSFLIKAFQVLDEWTKAQMNQPSDPLGDFARKTQVLVSNIYGVDLDSEAAEIARLNLLLQTVTGKSRLPKLSKNIKTGNSLVEGTDEELEKSFGKNFKEIRPFNWQQEFPEVFINGGFDVVIGNPPYLKEMDNKTEFETVKKSNYEKYYQGKMDLWYLFLHRAMDVIKPGGYIGFITNSYFLKGSGASKLIERLKKELVLVKAVDFGDIKIFQDVSGRHLIHIWQKREDKDYKTEYIEVKPESFINVIKEEKILLEYKNIFNNDKINLGTGTNLIFKNTAVLGDLFDVSQGVVEATDKISKKAASAAVDTSAKVGDGVFVLTNQEIDKLHLNQDENKIIKRYLNNSDVKKYAVNFNDQFLIYSDKKTKEDIAKNKLPNLKVHLEKMSSFITSSNRPFGLHRPREAKYFENPKLICKAMFLSPEFTYDEEKYYCGFSFSVIIQKDYAYSLKYLLGILNSKLAMDWFNTNGKKRGVGVDIGVLVYRQFPVYKASPDQQKFIVQLVDKALDLNKKLYKLPINSDEWHEIKIEVEKLHEKIDEEVFKLYGLKE